MRSRTSWMERAAKRGKWPTGLDERPGRNRYRGDDLDGARSRQEGIAQADRAADREHREPDPVASGARHAEFRYLRLGRPARRILGHRLVLAERQAERA